MANVRLFEDNTGQQVQVGPNGYNSANPSLNAGGGLTESNDSNPSWWLDDSYKQSDDYLGLGESDQLAADLAIEAWNAGMRSESSVGDYVQNNIIQKVEDGSITAEQALAVVSRFNPDGIKPEVKDYLTNMLSKQRTGEAYDQSIKSIGDTARANQAAAIETGLNPSAYLMAQGANNGIQAGVADVKTSNVGSQLAMAKFNRKTQMAQTMLRLIGGMATSGIYGGSMAAAKTAVAGLTTAATKDAAMIRADAYKSGRVKQRYHIDGLTGMIRGYDQYDY